MSLIERDGIMKVYSDENGWPCTESSREQLCVGVENCKNKSCPLVQESVDLHTKLDTNHVDTEK